MHRQPYSIRRGTNPNAEGLPLTEICDLFRRLYDQLEGDGFTHEAFGFACVDADWIEGRVRDVELEILLKLRKKYLWPIATACHAYTEDDLFDMIEFLYEFVSKPLTGTMHPYNGCGMHWETFNKKAGQAHYRQRINELLSHYVRRFELSEDGEVLERPDAGFEPIFAAELPTADEKLRDKVLEATRRYRRHGSSAADRRHAVRQLADVLECLRPMMKGLLASKDESDLFNIANNFALRHDNDKQKDDYDPLWLSWMFYLYLATVHVILRKLDKGATPKT